MVEEPRIFFLLDDDDDDDNDDDDEEEEAEDDDDEEEEDDGKCGACRLCEVVAPAAAAAAAPAENTAGWSKRIVRRSPQVRGAAVAVAGGGVCSIAGCWLFVRSGSRSGWGGGMGGVPTPAAAETAATSFLCVLEPIPCRALMGREKRNGWFWHGARAVKPLGLWSPAESLATKRLLPTPALVVKPVACCSFAFNRLATRAPAATS